MSYQVLYDEQFVLDVQRHRRSGALKLVAKLGELVEELAIHPRVGTGKPERLKGYEAERWSRRIDSKYRLINEIRETDLVVIAISSYGHYGDR